MPKALAALLFLVSALFPVEVVKKAGDASKTFNEVDDDYRDRRGFAFYEDSVPLDNNDSNATGKKSVKTLLEAILEENRKQSRIQAEQLSVQQQILALLKQVHDPEPVMITKADGTRCLANETAECFDFGSLLIAEAKKVPVMAKYLSHPTRENAGEFLKWQSTYFNHNFRIGEALVFANKQWGEKVNPSHGLTAAHAQGTGRTRYYQDALEAELLKEYASHMEVYILIGKTPALDTFNPNGLFDAYDELVESGIEPTFVFPSSQYLAAYDTFCENSFATGVSGRWQRIKGSGHYTVDRKMIGAYDPSSTPYWFVAYDDGTTRFTQAFMVGNETRNPRQALFKTLYFFGVVDRKATNPHRAFEIRTQEFENELRSGSSDSQGETQSGRIIRSIETMENNKVQNDAR